MTAIHHLKDLGVTAVELMPVHHHAYDRHLVERQPEQLLGLQHQRLLRAGRPLLDEQELIAERCASSRRWSAICTQPASR